MKRVHCFFRSVLLLPCCVTLLTGLNAHSQGVPKSGLLREVWEGLSGTTIPELTGSPDFPDHPTSTNYVTALFEAPTDALDNYGQRMRGYVVAPITGDYTFWIASDDNGQLFLSTDETPAKKKLIAQESTWSPARSYEATGGGGPVNEKNSSTFTGTQWPVLDPAKGGARITLQKGQAYYIEAMSKEGGGGDNLSVRWLMPNGIDQGPMAGTNLLPWGISLTAPVISENPTNTEAIEGGMASFFVKLADPGIYSYQWQRNGVPLAGATGPELLYGPVRLVDNNARFRCVVTNNLGSATSTEAVLTATPDITPPLLSAAQNLGTTNLYVAFSETVVAPSATDTNNYQINNGIRVLAVSFGGASSNVVLTTSPMIYGVTYTLTVNGVKDGAQQPNIIALNSKITFVATEYATTDIGSPAIPGGTTSVPDGVDVTGAGKTIGGTSDQFQFGWQQRLGNFDIQTRIENVTVSDAYVHAGLMARETLDASSRFAAAFASSSQLGCFFESRATLAGVSATVAPRNGFPVNYPQTWLRLQRTGNTLLGYAGLDGQVWTLLGSVTISDLPPTIYFGFAVTSDNERAAATARFRNIETTTSTAVGPLVLNKEPVGPSSRATGMIFSEIMYHPAPRTDWRKLAFLEVHNARSIFEDLTGWRVAGDVDFAFPAGFRLQAGETVVIAAVPEDVKAVYGITNVLGPYTGSLLHAGGRIQLRNNADAIRLEVRYNDMPPWPVSADGAGHSLVLARPSYGEGDVRAWAASEFRGGSPGFLDPSVPAPETSIVINEFLAHTDLPEMDFIELYNHSANRVDLSGMVLTDDTATNKFRVPQGTFLDPRGFRSWNQNELGFALSAAGETIFLVNSNGTRVLDAIRFGPQENGVASGRSPDGAPAIRRLSQPTPGAANAPWRVEDIVINELMYKPISGDDNDEYIELYNRTPLPVSLAGWKFVSGVGYTFPANAIIQPNGYLVVAKNAARLLANYPQLNTANTLGDYQGTLGDAGDRLALASPDTIVSTNSAGRVETNLIHIVVAEVVFGNGGRWGRWADGGGSSLELIDPRADPLQPASWADSDETSKGRWTTLEYTGRLDNSLATANRLRVTLLGAGECLVDDIEALRVGSTNVVNNGDFENGKTAWVFSGNHSTSAVENTGAASGAACLHLRAQGDGDTGPNSLRNTLRTTLASNTDVSLRAKVRWLAGWPQILLRLHGGGLEMAADLEVPRNLGTPGLPNSRLVQNAGPAIYDVAHFPAAPAANEKVRVTCRVSDPDGLANVQLRYRLDPATALTSVLMRDDGTLGDEVAGDGVYSAWLPGSAAGVLIAFRITATDAAATPATAMFPARAPAEECLVRFGDTIPFGTLAHYHLWFTQATSNLRVNALDNTFRDSTLVYNNYRVIYNTGFRDKGSPYHGGSGDIAATTPEDEPLLGSFDRIFASTGNGDSEATGIRSQLAAWFAQQLGVPYLHAHYMRLYFNGSLFRPSIMEDLEQPNHDYAARWFPSNGNDDLYKVACNFEFGDDNRSMNATGATIQRFITGNNQYKLARYRFNWQRRSNDGDASNYAQFFDLVSAVNDASANYVPGLLAQANMEEWMRVFCFDYAMGNWDAWTYNVGQNMYLYRPSAERWVLLPWDIDFVFGLGDGTSGALRGGGQDPIMSRAYANPTFQRMNWRAYQDTVNGPYQLANFGPQIEARRSILLKNAVSGLSAPGPLTNWINSRRTYISGQLNNADSKTFAITTNGGVDFESTTPTVTLSGTAPFAVSTIEVNGVPFPLSWTSVRTYNLTVPLAQATNRLSLVGKDLRGNPVPGASDTIEITYAGAVEHVEDFVVINEVHYNPAPDEPASSFIELFNRSAATPFDLSGFELQGAGYTFPAGAFISPQSYLLLVGNRLEFEAVYGRNLPILGEFSGGLDNNGERLALVRPADGIHPETIISDLRYHDHLPWPTNAAGWGSSLQLVDAAQGSWRVGNWAAPDTNIVDRTTPGRANFTLQGLPEFPPVWINEVQPSNLTGPLDGAGDRDPWIELYNAGTNTVDLSPFYLTDSYTNLTRWRFPDGTTIGPEQFLVVWADGEPGESKPGEPHTSFRLAPSTGAVALARLQGFPAGAVVMDYQDYSLLSPGRSIGCYPNGNPRWRRQFAEITPGAANNPSFPSVLVKINEFMASNTHTLADLADGNFDDWFELYNAGNTPADLSGYTLTDDLLDPTKHTIPPGTIIPAKGFLLVWADQETGQNIPGGDLHVSFKLSATGEQLGLFDPSGVMVDGFVFAAQTDDVSMGLYPDGAEQPLYAMTVPTPGKTNVLEGGNRPPIFTTILPQVVNEGTELRLTAKATDADAGQTIRYSLGPDAPAAATIDPVTGLFRWTPSEADGPGQFSILLLATDSGSPPRTSTTRFNVDVNEVNLPPVIDPIMAQVADEGTLFTLQVSAIDPDVPANPLVFSLGPGAPEGATLSEDGGFAWIPGESMGGSNLPVNVVVADRGAPPLSATRTFFINVRETQDPPDVPFIDPQSINEGATFQLQISASDRDTPPSPLRFTLDQAPAGATIDSVSGLITWPTSEATGPTNAIFVARVTELNPPNLSSARTFSVQVLEVNTPPILAPIANRVAQEGALLVITNSAMDTDLPPQKLTYSLAPDAPPGATIDPSSGLFTWLIGEDSRSTNLITIRVTDDAPQPYSSSRSFIVTVISEPRVVINEIMYKAATNGAEFVELHNWSTNKTWDLSGWRLTGFSYVFPAGTQLAPGGFLVVAASKSHYLAAYGQPPSLLLGDFVNQLAPTGGVIELYRSATMTDETRVDRVSFRASAPWPAAANGTGASLQLIDPRQDNSRVANWAAVMGQTTNAPRNLIPIDAAWRYWQEAANPAAGWTNLVYDDSAWPIGKALLYYESAALPEAKNTQLALGQMSYLFRTSFNFSGNPEGASLQIRTVIDDGAVFYLNGKPFFWLGMPEDVIPDRAATTTRSVSDAVYEGPFTNVVDNLRVGTNVLAVEVHQTSAGSSDIVMGASVDVVEVSRAGCTPGYANSVRASLDPFPALGINEVLAVNQAGIADNAGDRDPWIELANWEFMPVALGGWYLSDSYAALDRWQFPKGSAISGNEFRVVWADGETNETTATQWHTGFRLSASGGIVALSRLQNGAPAVVDYLEYPALEANRSFGYLSPREEDSVAGLLALPTPGAANAVTSPEITAVDVGANGEITVQWASVPGASYRVDASEALQPGAWSPLGTVTATGNDASFTDTKAAGIQTRFYRVSLTAW